VDLEPTDEQRELRAGARSLLADRCPPALVRQVTEKGSSAEDLWASLVEQGWTALTLPESAGGLGLGPVEAGILAEELGRVVAPTPWWETVGAYASVVPSSASAELAEVAEGTLTGTVAGLGDARTARSGFTATETGGSWTVTGLDEAVPRLASVDRLAVVAQSSDGPVVLAVDERGTPVHTIDATRPWSRLQLTDAPARLLGPLGPHGVALPVALLSAEAVGVSQSLLDQTVEYVKVREQFGVPIGSFQGLKHGLADAHLVVQRARAAVTYALLTLAEDHPRAQLAAHMAKSAASDAANHLAQLSIQYHGGIGYTWEHDLHLWVKRARADAVLLGTAASHRQRIADLIGLPTA
jgi:alkylation response protein AidB-like acyl-CoA dehydrogenase